MRHQLIPTIQIEIKPSYVLFGWYLLVSIVSAFSLTHLPLGANAKWLAISLILVLASYYILRDALLVLPWSWCVVRTHADGEVELVNKRQMVYAVVLLPSSVCHPYLVVLRFNPLGWQAGCQSALYLTPFRVENSAPLRRLRVWMRWRVRPSMMKQTEYGINP